MNGETILLVEDDPGITRVNRMALELIGCRVLEADTLEKGRELVERETPNLIILDIKLPDGNGLEYCQELRGGNNVSILFLSALNTKEDTITGLRVGGDDYITKPYLVDELLARVEALLRRGRMNSAPEQPLRFGSLEIHFSPRRVCLNGEDLLLKPKEFALLETLVRERDRYITAGELYEKIWGMDALEDMRTVWAHVSRIRKKLGDGAPVDIASERGRGYRLIVK